MSESAKIERPFFRSLGNALTRAKLVGCTAISANIAANKGSFRSWRLAGIAAGVFALDALDGALVRYSNLPNPNGAEEDEKSDKYGYLMMMASLAYATEDPRYGVYMAITEGRNIFIEEDRIKLREAGIKADARALGKAKMWTQCAALVADLSPLGDSHAEIVHQMHAVAVGSAVLSGLDFKMHTKQQLAANGQA